MAGEDGGSVHVVTNHVKREVAMKCKKSPVALGRYYVGKKLEKPETIGDKISNAAVKNNLDELNPIGKVDLQKWLTGWIAMQM